MSFSLDTYEPVRSMTLPNGEYECIIRSVEEKDGKFGSYLEITLQARGKKGWTPNKIIINEPPVIGKYKSNGNPITEDDLKRWNRDMTTFSDAFGFTWIKGRSDFSYIINKIGWCKVTEQYDQNEPDKKSKKYKRLMPFVKVEETQPQPQEEYQTAPEGEQAPLSEDIPF